MAGSYDKCCFGAVLLISLLLPGYSLVGPTPPRAVDARNAPSAEQCHLIVPNLLKICDHLQNPALYSADWANAADVADDFNLLIANRHVQAGEILSLYPVHAIGLLGDGEETSNVLLFALDCFDQRSILSSKYRLDLHTNNFDKDEALLGSLFLDVNPIATPRSGWMAHLAKRSRRKSNSKLVQIPGACPLVALIATRTIARGQEIRRSETLSSSHDNDGTWHRYASEFAELRNYLNMAYSHIRADQDLIDSVDNNGRSGRAEFRTSFMEINRQYPGVYALHNDPEILAVDDFLTVEECENLIKLVRPHLIPCLVKNPRTGSVETDVTRTSTNANVPQRQVQPIVDKLLALVNCTSDQLEILQVLRYTDGQYFLPHTDGFDGPTTACGFRDSGRLATIFCYLNSLSDSGATRFPRLDLDIIPQRGRAVIHFPTTLGLEEDGWTEHEGLPASHGSEKWLLVTWVWKHPRTDGRYMEDQLDEMGTNDGWLR